MKVNVCTAFGYFYISFKDLMSYHFPAVQVRPTVKTSMPCQFQVSNCETLRNRDSKFKFQVNFKVIKEQRRWSRMIDFNNERPRMFILADLLDKVIKVSNSSIGLLLDNCTKHILLYSSLFVLQFPDVKQIQVTAFWGNLKKFRISSGKKLDISWFIGKCWKSYKSLAVIRSLVHFVLMWTGSFW